MSKNEKSLNEQYLDAMTKRTENVQATGEVPSRYVYENEGHTWVLTLPRSVMEQKRLIHARNEYFARETYETEEVLLRLMVANARVDEHEVRLENLSLGEIEVMKLAFLDGLLLPLSLGGENAVKTYMQKVIPSQN